LTLVLIGATVVLIAALAAVLVTIRRSTNVMVALVDRGARVDLWLPLLGSLPDRVDRRQLQLETRIEVLERRRALDAEILNGLSEAVLALDRAQHVVLANRRFSDLFGIEGWLVDKPLREIIRISAVFEGIDRAFSGSESVERFSIRSGVVERKIEMRALPVASEEIRAVALFIDVTQIERLEQIRRNFISDFSHEVRTPLAGLRSAVETYEGVEHLNDEEERQLRRIMSRQLLRLERLVEDLSELSRIESGELSLSRHPVDLRRVIDELCEDFAERAAQDDIRFVVRGDGVAVTVDALRIQQAFSNLIDNAIKYGGAGQEIRIDVLDRGESGVVQITDQGEGIPRDEKERIFRRFHRLHKSRSQEIAGSGLGLAITKHLVLQHNGSIDVESEPGRGATFIVRLPKQ
jgi:two-component system, OmpR family, phosphate regulon sensor histidine kinase PhoR